MLRVDRLAGRSLAFRANAAVAGEHGNLRGLPIALRTRARSAAPRSAPGVRNRESGGGVSDVPYARAGPRRVLASP